jgi:hypothetical protein
VIELQALSAPTLNALTLVTSPNEHLDGFRDALPPRRRNLFEFSGGNGWICLRTYGYEGLIKALRLRADALQIARLRMPDPLDLLDPQGLVTQGLYASERITILAALAKTKGGRGSAAKLLGIGRTTLYRKMKEYGID